MLVLCRCEDTTKRKITRRTFYEVFVMHTKSHILDVRDHLYMIIMFNKDIYIFVYDIMFNKDIIYLYMILCLTRNNQNYYNIITAECFKCSDN